MSRKWKCTFDANPRVEFIEADTEEEANDMAQKYVGFKRAYFGYQDCQEILDE